MGKRVPRFVYRPQRAGTETKEATVTVKRRGREVGREDLSWSKATVHGAACFECQPGGYDGQGGKDQ